ncbi:adenylate kinase 8 [Caerostris darwini]|uniref:Adenylate kinase 8 n=1 Tax=Caerostris darwini TaxID=1538125 RepID=A0AAV4VS32_9ARAC|nr:adenylate kinase 8 [Caerostris darwini]
MPAWSCMAVTGVDLAPPTLLEHLAIDRPPNPIEFLYDLVMKSAVFDVPRVYVLGPPTVDRKLVCAALASKMNLVYLTQESLKPETSSEQKRPPPSGPSELVRLMKDRVEQADCVRTGWLIEAFPKTRRQAFALRKAGIFPTHIIARMTKYFVGYYTVYTVVIDDPVITQRVTLRSCPEVSDILSEEGLREMVDYLGHVDLILDLHAKSYAKKFRIGHHEDAEKSIERVIEFVRTRQRPPEPYLPRVLLFGPYGSGCLEMARRLAKKFHLVEVDFRRELRSAALKDSPLKDKFYDIMRTSEPVPDELLVQVASERLLQEECVKSGWIMYNFPDSKVQVELLVKALEGFQVNRAVFLDATLETCLERMEPRRWDPSTGEIYHLKLRPCTEPKALNRLIQMPQDSEDSVKADHELYHAHCLDVKTFFKHQMQEDIAVEVDANSPEEAVFEMIQGAILKSAKMKMPQED